MISRLTMAAWLVVVWVALWSDISVANILGGSLVAFAVLALFPTAGPRPGFTVRPLHAVRLAAYFLYKLVEANIVVAWEVLTPNNDSVREGVVAVEVTGASDAVVTVLANAISLTPGTLTLDVVREPTMLFVHVLHLRSVERTRAEVHRLETLVLRAFGDDAAIAAHTRAIQESAP